MKALYAGREKRERMGRIFAYSQVVGVLIQAVAAAQRSPLDSELVNVFASRKDAQGKDEYQGVTVVRMKDPKNLLRRGSVRCSKQYPGEGYLPSNELARAAFPWAEHVQDAFATNETKLDDSFKELPDNATWLYNNTGGEFVAWPTTPTTGQPQSYQFDSLDQFCHVALNCTVDDFFANPNLRGKLYFQEVPPQGEPVVLYNFADDILRNSLNDGEGVLLEQSRGYPGECLFVSRLSAAGQNNMYARPNLWLPLDMAKDAAFAFRAFAHEPRSKGCIHSIAEREYLRLRSRALLSVPWAELKSTQQLRSQLAPKGPGDNLAPLPPVVEVALPTTQSENQRHYHHWQIQNSRQNAYVGAAGGGEVTNKKESLHFGQNEIGFPDGVPSGVSGVSFMVKRDAPPDTEALGQREAATWYPTLLTSTAEATFVFHLVKSEPKPFYIAREELTIRQLVALLQRAVSGKGDESLPWYTADKRRQYEDQFHRALPGKPGMPDGPGTGEMEPAVVAWALAEYKTVILLAEEADKHTGIGESEAQFAAWLFQRHWERCNKANSPTKKGGDERWQLRQALFDLGRLRAYFAQRFLQSLELDYHQKSHEEGRSWDAFWGYAERANTITRGADNFPMLEPAELRCAYGRYKLARNALDAEQFPLDNLDPLDAPVTLLSPAIAKELLAELLGESPQFKPNDWRLDIPTPEQFAAACLREAASTSRRECSLSSWPSAALATNDNSVRCLLGNVSELVCRGQGQEASFGFMGGSFRDAVTPPTANFIPIELDASSPSIGLRLVLTQEPDAPDGCLPAAPLDESLWADGQPLRQSFAALWGASAEEKNEIAWRVEKRRVEKFLGKHNFWHVERLRRVLWGAAGDADFSDQLADQKLIERAYETIMGTKANGG